MWVGESTTISRYLTSVSLETKLVSSLEEIKFMLRTVILSLEHS